MRPMGFKVVSVAFHRAEVVKASPDHGSKGRTRRFLSPISGKNIAVFPRKGKLIFQNCRGAFKISQATSCATVAPRTCWKTGPTSVSSSRCSDTRSSTPPPFTPKSRSSSCRRFTPAAILPRRRRRRLRFPMHPMRLTARRNRLPMALARCYRLGVQSGSSHCFTFLAADRQQQEFARPTSPRQTCVRVFCAGAAGRYSSRHGKPRRTAAGCGACGYKTASGRRSWGMGQCLCQKLYATITNLRTTNICTRCR
jgi:hypothetical protein